MRGGQFRPGCTVRYRAAAYLIVDTLTGQRANISCYFAQRVCRDLFLQTKGYDLPPSASIMMNERLYTHCPRRFALLIANRSDTAERCSSEEVDRRTAAQYADATWCVEYICLL